MRICLVQPLPADSRAGLERLAALLSGRHEVVVLDGEAGPSKAIAGISYACEEHRRSAAVMEQLRDAYGDRGPDYLELADAGATGLVALQARESGDPLLGTTLVGIRISPSRELTAFHDGVLTEPLNWRVAELEREQLRLGDRLIWPGGDTLELYRRYYADVELPEAVRIGFPVEPVAAPAAFAGWTGEGPLKILFAGGLRRHLGALDLAEACLALAAEDWELTMIGRDSATAMMGQSVQLTIEAMAGEDPRLRLEDAVPVAELRRRLPEYDLLVVPSRVDAWSDVAGEAMRAGLPVLVTPVGGLAEIVEDGASGWHTAGLGADQIGRALAHLLGDRGELERVSESGRVQARARELADPAPILAGYDHLAELVTSLPVSAEPPLEPLVTGIVPYYGLPEHVAEAVGSLLGQTHPKLEVLIVNDGSFAKADSVLTELAADPRVGVVTQPNRGEAAARNLGALLAGGEYLVMLDADNVLEPEFVERALRAFRREPDLAYVTCWLRMVELSGAEFASGYGYAPLGNAVIADDSENWDGDTVAMLPRRLFTEQGFQYDPEGAIHADWELYRWLRAEGRFGAVIPERLVSYRVRPDSLLRTHGWELREWAWGEARGRNLQRRTRWIAGS